MERGSIRVLVMVGLIMGMLVGQSSGQSRATFKDCYAQCFIFCVITPNNTAFSCSLQCLKDCLIPFRPSDIKTADTTEFCKLGCAFSLCSYLSTKKDPAGEKVEGCVSTCSNKCTENHPSPSKTQQISPAKP